MSILGDRSGQQPPTPPRSEPRPAAPPVPPVPSGATEGGPERNGGRERSPLERRRDALAAEVTELHWDLGGLAYEMAIRDHFRLDVLVRRAATLQERDAELAEVERLMRMDERGIAGSCPSCSAPHSRGAVYCWQCGSALMQSQPARALTDKDAPTDVMDALLLTPESPPEPAE
jgi:hypothetical protein